MLSVVTVNTDQDIVDPNDQLTSLREAVEMTNDLDGADEIVIDFGHDEPATIRLEHSELELAVAVTITGPGRELLTIDADHRSRIFNITAKEGDFAIEGLTLTGGRGIGRDDPFVGGAIRSDTAGVLTLRNSAITNSEITMWGGGAAIAAGGDVAIESSIISGNIGFTVWGSVLARGHVTVSSSTFTENWSGGIRADGDVAILSSTFSQNGDDALEWGRILGGPVPGIIDSGGDVTVRVSTITRNSTTGVRAKGDVSISSSTISGNRGGVYIVVAPVRIAGGIHASGDVTITSSTISGNIEGGIHAGTIRTGGNATIKSSTIAGNPVGANLFELPTRGAGVTFFRDLNLENSIVAANQGGDLEFVSRSSDFYFFCSRRGDCPEEHIPEWNVKRSLIGHNLDTPLVETLLEHPDANGNLIGGPVGGAIDPRLDPLADNGGPTPTHRLQPDSPAIGAGDSSLVADRSQFDQRGEPYAHTEHGRVDIGAYQRQDLLATVGNIPSPTVQSMDTVTIEFSSPVTGFDIKDMRLSRNTDDDLLTGNERLSSSDNQRFVLTGLTNLTDVPGFYTLRLVAPGSGIQAADKTPLDSSANVSWAMGRADFGLAVDTLVDEVDGKIDDGDVSLRDALAFAAPGETITFDPSLDGGTLLLSLGEIPIHRSVTVDATALPNGVAIDASGNDPTADLDDGQGSRVFVIDGGDDSFIDSPVTLRGLILTGGDIDSGGSAVLTQETLVIESTSVLRNSSIPTDSFICCRGAISGSGDVTISLSTISQNVGHGINTSGSVTVRSSTISKNSEMGLSTFGSGTVVIDSSTIFENYRDGIIASGPLTINSSTISGNNVRANRSWAGIGAGGSLTISSSTITENHGGVSASGELVSITNSILAGNRGDGGDLHLWFSESWFPDEKCCERTLVVQHSLIGDIRNTELPEAPVGTPDANGNLVGGPVGGAIDPRLGPLADNGGPTLTHALLPNSPAINTGAPSAVFGADDIPHFDQRGEPFRRVMDARTDIGAFESRPVGDSNGDGVFDALDLVTVLQAGKYEDDIANNATVDEGDWNGDGDFDKYDVVFALQAGNYIR